MENKNSLLRDRGGEQNKWKDIAYSWIEGFNIVKTAFLSKNQSEVSMQFQSKSQ